MDAVSVGAITRSDDPNTLGAYIFVSIDHDVNHLTV